MCTRYYLEKSEELEPYIEQAMRSPLRGRMVAALARPLKEEGEIRPTDMVPVLAPSAKTRSETVFPMIWGYSPAPGGSLLLNARVESADRKPTFRDSWLQRRCIIPASWYFEWQHFLSSDGKKKTGDKYAIQPSGASLTLLAGLYRIENGFPHFVVLTRDSPEGIRFLHDRMPVILEPAQAAQWIHPESSPETVRRIAETALTDMIYEKA